MIKQKEMKKSYTEKKVKEKVQIDQLLSYRR